MYVGWMYWNVVNCVKYVQLSARSDTCNTCWGIEHINQSPRAKLVIPVEALSTLTQVSEQQCELRLWLNHAFNVVAVRSCAFCLLARGFGCSDRSLITTLKLSRTRKLCKTHLHASDTACLMIAPCQTMQHHSPAAISSFGISIFNDEDGNIDQRVRLVHSNKYRNHVESTTSNLNLYHWAVASGSRH